MVRRGYEAVAAVDRVPDDEMLSYLAEYRFRKAFGASHEDFLNQPTVVTLVLSELDQELNKK